MLYNFALKRCNPKIWNNSLNAKAKKLLILKRQKIQNVLVKSNTGFGLMCEWSKWTSRKITMGQIFLELLAKTV